MVLASLAGKFTSSTFLQHFSLQSTKLFPHFFCRSAFFEVDPKVSQILVHSTTAPSTVAAGIALSAALLSRVQHSVCDFLGLMRDPVSWHHCNMLSSCCTALATFSSCCCVLRGGDTVCQWKREEKKAEFAVCVKNDQGG